jgi:hypothetical protein
MSHKGLCVGSRDVGCTWGLRDVHMCSRIGICWEKEWYVFKEWYMLGKGMVCVGKRMCIVVFKDWYVLGKGMVCVQGMVCVGKRTCIVVFKEWYVLGKGRA